MWQEIWNGIWSHALSYVTIPLYFYAWATLLTMGLGSHAAKVDGKPTPMYPTAYFVGMYFQLLPLSIFGLATSDGYIMATRPFMLVVVVICHVMVTDDDGRFTPQEYTMKVVGVLSVLSLAIVAWLNAPLLRSWFVHEEKVLGLFSLAGSVMYLVIGQGATMAQQLRRIRANQGRMPGLNFQVSRLVCFLLPALDKGVHYGFMSALFWMYAVCAAGSTIIVALYLAQKREKKIAVLS